MTEPSTREAPDSYAPTLSSQKFRHVLGHYPTGVAAVTSLAEDGTPVGMIVGTFSSASLDPPLVAFFADKGSTTWPQISAVGSFCVNVLSAQQEEVCTALARKGSDKFRGLDWMASPSGAPRFEGAVAWIDCDILDMVEAGDHFLVLGTIRDLEAESDARPLVFFRRDYGSFASRPVVPLPSAVSPETEYTARIASEIESLATELDAQCAVLALVEDQLVVMSTVGTGSTAVPPSPIGSQFPFAPPLGTSFAAWSDQDRLDRYLGKLWPGRTFPDRETCLAMLARVRRAGHSVCIGHEPRARLSEASMSGPLEGDLSHLIKEELTGLFDLYNPVDLTPDIGHELRHIGAPIFDERGEVALQLLLWGPPGSHTGDEIAMMARTVTETARLATRAIGGREPD